MKIKQAPESEGDIINISSLVDVMFILIIFFLVTMSFKEIEHDISVNLPKTDTTLSSVSRALVINVRQDGSYYLGTKRLNLAQLQQRLVNAVKRNPAQKVLVRGDKNAFHGNVAAAVAVCKRSGVKKANIGYVTSSI
ncbi:MAG: biopolymer transporter ExbD [Victivallales bacterium]|nr:biopolymer transporter ExbD [Victivallales bacterium]MCF7889054.1 biopolymer transporter ExbD [Victivallales bacterium]